MTDITTTATENADLEAIDDIELVPTEDLLADETVVGAVDADPEDAEDADEMDAEDEDADPTE